MKLIFVLLTISCANFLYSQKTIADTFALKISIPHSTIPDTSGFKLTIELKNISNAPANVYTEIRDALLNIWFPNFLVMTEKKVNGKFQKFNNETIVDIMPADADSVNDDNLFNSDFTDFKWYEWPDYKKSAPFAITNLQINPGQKFPPGDSTCKENFYKALFKDTTLNGSANIKITVAGSTGITHSMLISNQEFFYYMKKNKEMDYVTYKAFLKNLLNSKESLPYKEYQALLLHHHLDKDDYVEEIAKKGWKKIVQHFFVQDVFRWSEYYIHENAVIGKLFESGVLVANVENGQIGIIYKPDCE